MYYKHSGRFSIGGLVAGIGIGSAAGLILAFSYAHGLPLIPYDQLAGLATLAFGALIGVATGYGFIWGKVRNQPVAIAATATISTLALYISWAVWVSLTLESQHVSTVRWSDLSQHPAALWNWICLVNQYGTWGLNNQTPTKGLELSVLWILEAVVVIGAAIVAQFEILRHHVFCETCDRWCARGAKILLAAPKDVTQFKLQLETNDLRWLGELGVGNKQREHLTAVLNSCPQCRQLHTLSLTLTTFQKNKLGNSRAQNRVIVPHLILGPTQASAFRQIADNLANPARNAPKAAAAAASKR